jgi:predicted dehydrogenase
MVSAMIVIMNKVRWGIMSAAAIARKNWKGIRNAGNSTVVAVASRDKERGRLWIEECQASAPMGNEVAALGSYEELVASRDVDAIYIPIPTGPRAEWVIRAAEAGKHVVCEKPCATSVAELKKLIEACRRNNVQFMDGVMFMHSRRLEKIRAEIAAARIGALKRITSAFSFRGDADFFANNIRMDSGLEPFGSLGDLGWYDIRLALWTMKEELPERVSGRILAESGGVKSPGKVPTDFSGELFFKGGVSSSFFCSFSAATEQWAVITGTEGLITMRDFVLPHFGNEVSFEISNQEMRVTGCDFNMEPKLRTASVEEYSNSDPTSQETNLFRNFAAQVQSGKLNEEWPRMALNTQTVMEACLRSARDGGKIVSVLE